MAEAEESSVTDQMANVADENKIKNETANPTTNNTPAEPAKEQRKPRNASEVVIKNVTRPGHGIGIIGVQPAETEKPD